MLKRQEECKAQRAVVSGIKERMCRAIPFPSDLARIVYSYILPDVTIIDAIERALCNCDDIGFDASGRVLMYCRDCPMPGHHVLLAHGIVSLGDPIPVYLWKMYCVVYQHTDQVSEDSDWKHIHMFLCARSVYKWINAVAQAGP